MADSTDRYERFEGGGYSGLISSRCRPENVVDEVVRLVDPASAEETIHWGRNYLYSALLAASSGSVPVVVKQFKNQGWRKALERRLRGSKADRSWRGATAIADAGIATPEPLVLVESDRPDGPSFFVTRLVAPAFELRHFFRRINDDPTAGEFPDVDAEDLLKQLGRFFRRIHDAGVRHRDLSMGNVLLRPVESSELRLLVLDCNRVRLEKRMGTVKRCRDACRMPIVQSDHQDAFLEGYWGNVPSRYAFRRWFWAASVRGYLLKHAIKNRLKALKPARKHGHGGSHHPHLPQASDGASSRDKAVWDALSDQPHQHAKRWEKRLIRLADAPDHLRDLAAVAASAPAVWRRYRQLESQLHANPVPFDGTGVCLRPAATDREAHLAAVDQLGVRRVMVRLHPWDSDHEAEEWLVRSLHERGYDISFAVPQNRDLVRDRERWRAAIEEISDRFTPFGRHFQVGQAPNRSKWGVWSRGEFIELYTTAAEILRRVDGVEVMGPAVIDFEFQVTLALANRRHPGLHFDVLSSLLYVDRRGGPENRQMGLDTVQKVLLLRAIAEVGRNSSERLWVTEVNWPLWEGPHSPAGKTVSVDEETQADHLVRYYLLTLGTGLVERVYWWRLAARGYGLATWEPDDSLRRRPSYFALKTLAERLEGAEFLGPAASPAGVYLYRFQSAGGEQIVAWATRKGETVELPDRPHRAVGRGGEELPRPPGPTVTIGPSPVYYELDPGDPSASGTES